MNTTTEPLTAIPLKKQDIEIVERKGIGHPDSICDGIAESISQTLSRYYIENFGRILHHSTDQVQLVGGKSNPVFGGGEILQPMYLLLSGRATMFYGSDIIPIHRIAIEAARNYLRENLPHLNVDLHIDIDSRIHESSMDLVDYFEEDLYMPIANGTSFGVGFAPLTETEKLVLNVERFLNSKDFFKREYPALGEDIQIMGLRIKNEILLTVAAAFLSSRVLTRQEYNRLKEEIKEEIIQQFNDQVWMKLKVDFNIADTSHSVYLTVTGTRSEMGDDGLSGRGNRVNGLITPYRPMSLEAVAGRNPLFDVGKIYNLLAKKIADEVVEIEGIEEVQIYLLSQIGYPMNKPAEACARVITDESTILTEVASDIKEIMQKNIENVKHITELVVGGKLTVF